MTDTAIILVGGFGTRLKEVIKDVPKPMAPVSGKPFLHFLLSYLHKYQFKKVILSTGYLAEVISEYFGNDFKGMKLQYSFESEPLGTGGGIRLAAETLSEDEFLVLNGDSFFDVDLNAFRKLHAISGASISIALRKVQNASRYGKIELDSFGKVISFKEKEDKDEPGSINGGVYLIKKESFLSSTPAQQNFSIEKDHFTILANKGTLFGFEFRGYFIDIGIPEDYKRAQDEFKGSEYQ